MHLSGQPHFDEALKNGEIMEVDEDGEPQEGSSSSARGTKYYAYAFRKVEVGKETGVNSKQELERKKSITAENSKILDDLPHVSAQMVLCFQSIWSQMPWERGSATDHEADGGQGIWCQ